jgi:hypothetical protein
MKWARPKLASRQSGPTTTGRAELPVMAMASLALSLALSPNHEGGGLTSSPFWNESTRSGITLVKFGSSAYDDQAGRVSRPGTPLPPGSGSGREPL